MLIVFLHKQHSFFIDVLILRICTTSNYSHSEIFKIYIFFYPRTKSFKSTAESAIFSGENTKQLLYTIKTKHKEFCGKLLKIQLTLLILDSNPVCAVLQKQTELQSKLETFLVS